MSSDVFVVGVGMTKFGKFLEKSVKDFTRESVSEAMADAGVKQTDIGAAFFGNTSQPFLEGQHMVKGQIALRAMGFEETPISNIENACASSSTAFNLAFTHLKAGMSDVALAIGAEKMQSTDKRKGFEVFDGAWDVYTAQQTADILMKLGEGVNPPEGREVPANMRSLFMDVYASLCKYHMKRFGTTERHLAAVAAKNHWHSTMNPLAQYQDDMSIEDVLNARLISWPLTLPMCAPISDGGAAAILATEDGIDRLGLDYSRAIKVHASVLAGGTNREPEELEKQIGRLAANRAYNVAGLGPKDMSLAEVHDASAFAEIQQTENLGFCELGQGGWIAERGETKLGGRIPINTSGGLESKGHPIGATGIGQIHELVTQLRGEAGARQVENARFGIAENGGGFYRCEEALVCMTILGRGGL